ncbi:DUF3098 domain-containing protein [Sporocytophaga myxococcoides]|uniref:DUF3098 domain-containing protein n=1 Tax=Sporocytophaga myxococcoides TaxID=153721 RepID=UPI0009DBA5DA|nr:DUF3098 domain-containing protein [Sporocytophaga myxococcoides]
MNKLVFSKANYIIMLIGIAFLIIGFITMSKDDQPHGFGTLGLTIGPLFLLIGFIIQFVAIFYKQGKKE